ncbi:MAG: hypothetical protein MZU95_01435 [Desulfomicrobium escambiense]|nr:hypothetical protein [Desulfomicrobium escambiense]
MPASLGARASSRPATPRGGPARHPAGCFSDPRLFPLSALYAAVLMTILARP